jgi:hypothetical protein
MEHEIKFTYQTANDPLTEVRKERKAAVYAEEGKSVHEYGCGRSLSVDPQPVEEMRVSDVTGRRICARTRDAHSVQMTKAVVENDLATNTIDKHM